MSQDARPANPPSLLSFSGTGDHLRIDARLADSLDEAYRIFGVNPRLRPVFEHVKQFVLRGGKRIRPLLCLASYRILSDRADPPPCVWRIAASLEIFHAFMLIHDDIIDQSPFRRNEPTLHEGFRLSSGLESPQQAQKRGSDLALLSGDLLCALAMRLVARSGLNGESTGRTFRLLADMLIETGLGEALDVLYETDALDCLSEAPLVETYLRKTARYTVSGPLVMGATVAGASPRVCDALDRFGDLLGFAFQIQNDLDSLNEDLRSGDHADLDSGKRTFVLWRAYHNSNARHQAALRAALAEPVSLARRIRLFSLIESSGAIEHCRNHVDRLQTEAVQALRSSGLPKTQHRAYVDLVEQLKLKPKTSNPAKTALSPVASRVVAQSEIACNPS